MAVALGVGVAVATTGNGLGVAHADDDTTSSSAGTGGGGQAGEASTGTLNSASRNSVGDIPGGVAGRGASPADDEHASGARTATNGADADADADADEPSSSPPGRDDEVPATQNASPPEPSPAEPSTPDVVAGADQLDVVPLDSGVPERPVPVPAAFTPGVGAPAESLRRDLTPVGGSGDSAVSHIAPAATTLHPAPSRAAALAASRSATPAPLNGSAAALAAPGTPAPAPLRPQPANPIEAVIGGAVAVANILTTAVTTVLNGLLAPGPNTPAPPVLLFAVVGYVQRQLQRTFLNQTPTATPDIAATTTGAPIRIPVLANDTDPDLPAGDILTVTDYTQPANGTATLNTDGSVTYTPRAGFTGVDTFGYTVSDAASDFNIKGLTGFFVGGGHTATTTVTVTVAAPPNTAPIAVGDGPFSLTEDTPRTFTAVELLGNDTDPDDDTLRVNSVSGATNGTVTLNTDGTVTFTPTRDYNGLAQFSYTAADPAGAISNTATATLDITAVDKPLDAADDAAGILGNATAPATGNVLNNDTGTGLVVTNPGTVQGNYGTLTLNADGSYTYNPGANATDSGVTVGPDGGTVALSDAIGAVAGTLPSFGFDYVAVAFVPNTTGSYVFGQTTAPVDTFLYVYDGPFDPANPGAGIIASDNNSGDPADSCGDLGRCPRATVDLTAGQTYTVVVYSLTSAQPLDSLLVYTEGPGVFGNRGSSPLDPRAIPVGDTAADTFSYTVRDADGATATATLTVTLTGANGAPTALDDTAATDGVNAVVGNVLGNDTDPDGDTFTVTNPAITQGQYGALVLDADGSYTYAPGAVVLGGAAVTQGTASDPAVDFWRPATDGTPHTYVATTFVPTDTGTYQFDQPVLPRDAAGGEVDTVLHLYRGAFDPADPGANRIAFDDDSAGSLRPSLVVDLVAGQTYSVVVSNFSPQQLFTAPVVLFTDGPGVFGGSIPSIDLTTIPAGATDTFTYTATDRYGAVSNPAALTVTVTVTVGDGDGDGDGDGAIVLA